MHCNVFTCICTFFAQAYKNTHTVAYYDQYEHPETLPPYALGEMDFWWFNAEKAAKLKAAGVLK